MTTPDYVSLFTRCSPLMDNVRDGMMLVDMDGIVQLINKRARAMYAGGEAPLVGYPLSDFNAADWVEVKRVLASGLPLEAQRMTLPATEVLIQRTPLQLQGSMVGVICSMTCLVENDKYCEHFASYQYLQQEREAFLAFPDMGMLVVDRQGYICHVNALFEKVIGKSRESLLGVSLLTLGKEDTLGMVSLWQHCAESLHTAVQSGQSACGNTVYAWATPAYIKDECRYIVLRTWDEETVQRYFSDALPAVDTALAHALPLHPHEDPIFHLAHSLGLVLKSRQMLQLVHKMARVGQTESSVLLQGESGVGKSVFAKMLHALSQRGEAPFVAINCGAIPESLMESELFGYERGAFTGADPKGKVGLLEAGHGGTVFFDEVGELPMPMQVKLLEAIDKKSFMRVGGTRSITVDIRIIAATNRMLEEEVSAGHFRKDLYYRLRVIPLTIPPLRERPEDIEAVAVDYLARYNAKHGVKKRLSPEVMRLLSQHPYHGNMRELLNTLEWLVVMSEGTLLTQHDLPMSFHGDTPPLVPITEAPSPASGQVEGMTLHEAIAQTERHCIEKAVARHDTLYEAAQALGVHPTTLWRKMSQLRIARSDV